MTIRDFRPFDCAPSCHLPHAHGKSDIQRIRQIYQGQGFDYAEPDWRRMEGKVLVDDEGIVRTYELARKTCEMYAGQDMTDWATPGVKAEQFKRLDLETVLLLRSRGYEDQHAWIPPRCRAFVRRMLRELGWVRTDQGESRFIPLLRWIG